MLMQQVHVAIINYKIIRKCTVRPAVVALEIGAILAGDLAFGPIIEDKARRNAATPALTVHPRKIVTRRRDNPMAYYVAHGKMALAMDRLIVSLLNTAVEDPDPLETALGTARWWASERIAVGGKPRFDLALSQAVRTVRSTLAALIDGADAAVTPPPPFRGDASDAIMFEVLYAVRTMQNAGTLRRIRRCLGQTCGRYFADQTKNGSKRWCSLRCMERARVPRRRTISR